MMEFARWALVFHPTSGAHRYLLRGANDFLRETWNVQMKDWDWESVIIDYYTMIIAGGYEPATEFWIENCKKRATP